MSQHTSPFDAIRHLNENENEYWSARELAKLLDYAKWDKFKVALDRARKACEQSGQAITDHFLQVGNMVKIGSGAQRKTEDYHLFGETEDSRLHGKRRIGSEYVQGNAS